MDKNTILKNIGSIGRASKKLTADIQETAVGCIEHAVIHGDITLCDQLVDAIGKGMRKASLRAWFETNGPMYLPKGKDKFAFDASRRGEWNADREAALLATPWEDAKPEEPVASVLDVSEAFDRFINRLAKQIKQDTITVENAELFTVISQAAAKWQSEKVLSNLSE